MGSPSRGQAVLAYPSLHLLYCGSGAAGQDTSGEAALQMWTGRIGGSRLVCSHRVCSKGYMRQKKGMLYASATFGSTTVQKPLVGTMVGCMFDSPAYPLKKINQ